METNQIEQLKLNIIDILYHDYFDKDQYEITADTITKNNNVKKHAIRIRQHDANISPTIYLSEDKMAADSPEALAQDIYRIYKEQKTNEQDVLSSDISKFLDYDYAKNYICFRLVNREMNQHLCDSYPTMPVSNDLMLIFTLHPSKDTSININNKLTETWGLADDAAKDLYSSAAVNTPRLFPPTLRPLADVLAETLYVDGTTIDTPLFVLSNAANVNGASTLVYQEGKYLEECYQTIKSKYPEANGMYILPSSIHELILVPNSNELNIDIQDLQFMVSEVNSTEVATSDILSNKVLLYDEDSYLKDISFSEKEYCR